jgi:CheY-like chemotaxis protein
MKERILVVDDEPIIADALARLLTHLGYNARAIYDGRDAIEVAAEFLPDMIFVDIGMPNFDGFQTVAGIRRRHECAHAILVALTGWSRREDKDQAYQGGFDLFVTKPISMDTLKELLSLFDPSKSDSTAKRIFRMVTANGT